MFQKSQYLFLLGNLDYAILKQLRKLSIFFQLLYQEPSPGITYEYSVPKGVSSRTSPDHYSWVYDDFGPCTTTCGGGKR